ncbi:MAG: hypothetical protein FJY67_10260 [Calditrichaeota bacterium]|nr:hypothetical protein [Calditrichota bacterium]
MKAHFKYQAVGLALTMALAASAVAAGSEPLSRMLFNPDEAVPALALTGLTPSASAAQKDAGKGVEELNPGKALILSAILPGMGERYAGLNWRAAAFLAIEAAAWTGVILYYNQGMDQDKEFKKYADAHFTEGEYRRVEYDLAISPQWGDSGAYTRSEPEWVAEEWDVKIHYLPSTGFTHEMPTREDRNRSSSDDQQYYEMIGKYIRQFGFGWDDRFGDDPGTPYFDGRSLNSERYMDMRYESNQMLERSAIAIQVAMLNHVASALHASFAVRAIRMKAKAEVGFRSYEYGGKRMALAGLNFKW